jgi:hypothetical protein
MYKQTLGDATNVVIAYTLKGVWDHPTRAKVMWDALYNNSQSALLLWLDKYGGARTGFFKDILDGRDLPRSAYDRLAMLLPTLGERPDLSREMVLDAVKYYRLGFSYDESSDFFQAIKSAMVAEDRRESAEWVANGGIAGMCQI